jgi:hypothetical protein
VTMNDPGTKLLLYIVANALKPIVVTAVLFSLTVLANFSSATPLSAPTLKAGRYVFSGELKTLLLFREELVHGTSDAVEARTNQLISDGYECQRASDASQTCRKALTPQQLPEPEYSRQRSLESNRGALDLGSQTGDAVLVSDGNLPLRWSVPQPLRYQGKTYGHIFLLLIPARDTVSEILKIKTPDDSIELVVDRDTHALYDMMQTRLTPQGATVPQGGTIIDAYTFAGEHNQQPQPPSGDLQ